MSYISRRPARNVFEPQDWGSIGMRPSVRRILDLVDVNDPAFGRVASLLSDMVTAGVDLDEAAVTIAVKLGRAPSPDASETPEHTADLGLPLWGATSDRQSIVYYIRRGSLIKIGTTGNPKARFMDLIPDEILAFEPGDRKVETLRHRQFAALRKGSREYFTPAAILMRHIKRIRSLHGDPDSSWTTMENVGRRASLTREPSRPESPRVATATEIARELGLKPNTVHAWVHRGILQPVADSRSKRPVYFVEHARQLAADSAAWKARQRPA